MELVIEKIINGGYGLARNEEGLVVLVPLVLPGETIRTGKIRKSRKHLIAETESILEPSSQRITAPCRYYGYCGGCDLQHASYDHQLTIKQSILIEQLGREGLFSRTTAENFLDSVIQSPKCFAYRQRVRLQVDSEGRIGFFRPGTHSVIPVSRCEIARPELNTALEYLLSAGQIPELMVRTTKIEMIASPEEEKVHLVFSLKVKPRKKDVKICAVLCAGSEVVQSIVLKADGFAPTNPITAHGESNGENRGAIRLILGSSPRSPLADTQYAGIVLGNEIGGFTQVNPEQNENLISTVCNWAAEVPHGRILDLYCGMGNFSIPLAFMADEIIGMDLQRSAIRSAQANARQAGLENCSFRKAAAEEGIGNLITAGEHFDLLLLDPPRQGSREIIAHVKASGCRALIYVSCDPATLTRDLGLLAEQGFQIKKMRLVDMFPQTHHMETITLLTKK